jgi:hypothetical protein
MTGSTLTALIAKPAIFQTSCSFSEATDEAFHEMRKAKASALSIRLSMRSLHAGCRQTPVLILNVFTMFLVFPSSSVVSLLSSVLYRPSSVIRHPSPKHSFLFVSRLFITQKYFH